MKSMNFLMWLNLICIWMAGEQVKLLEGDVPTPMQTYKHEQEMVY